MTIAEDQAHDDGRVWGYMNGMQFIPLPKQPFLLSMRGPPPFSVVLPSGDTRNVIHDPNEVAL